MRALFLIFVIFATSQVFADSIAEDFLKEGSEVPLALQAQGYTQFGRLNLDAFLTELPNYEVSFSEQVDKLNGNGRISAHWQADGRIYVYRAWWDRFKEQRPVLALHEYLGAAGYNDDQYWISVSLWFLALPETKTNLSATIRSRIAGWITKNANLRLAKGTQMAGGVVGIGGGGESGTLFMKMHGLRDSLLALGKPLSAIDREYNLGMISHYLSSETTVTWGNRGGK